MLKTPHGIIYGDDVVSFQSLIGMLKTHSHENQISRVFRVSIPHRYAENRWWALHFGENLKVSIPHRYAENVLEYIEKALSKLFQSLIGMLKT